MGDLGFDRGYRDHVELEEAWGREPIGRFRNWLLEENALTQQDIEDIEAEVEREMERAVEFAKQSPLPDLSELKEHVYA